MTHPIIVPRRRLSPDPRRCTSRSGARIRARSRQIQQWDAASKALALRVDGAPVFVGHEGIAVAAPHVPARDVRTSTSAPNVLAPGPEELATPSSAEARVSNLRVVP